MVAPVVDEVKAATLDLLDYVGASVIGLLGSYLAYKRVKRAKKKAKEAKNV